MERLGLLREVLLAIRHFFTVIAKGLVVVMLVMFLLEAERSALHLEAALLVVALSGSPESPPRPRADSSAAQGHPALRPRADSSAAQGHPALRPRAASSAARGRPAL